MLFRSDEVSAVVVNVDRKTRNIQLSVKAKDNADQQEAMASLCIAVRELPKPVGQLFYQVASGHGVGIGISQFGDRADGQLCCVVWSVPQSLLAFVVHLGAQQCTKVGQAGAFLCRLLAECCHGFLLVSIVFGFV